MSSPPFSLRPLAAAALSSFVAAAAAQAPPASPSQTIVITGNPLGRSSGVQAASVLTGEALLQRRGATLGETLDGLPGVAASGFGPNASRPVIRGLDGERVRLLDNGGASLDASALSFDHAPATDPLVAERIEVLRGPAVLLYGGNAIGGVVNSIDNRIPQRAASAVTGRAEVRGIGAATLRSAAAVLEGGSGALAWHADAFGRRQGDLRVPRFTPAENGEPLDETATRVRNSASRSSGGAVGASFIGASGYLGAAVDTVQQRYGITAEPDVFIRLQRDRLSLAGDWRAPAGGVVSRVEGQASHTRYRHDEVEGSGEIGTRFANRGSELRLALQHAPLGAWRGVVGVQGERQRFSALGEEAFVPPTETRSAALFVLEEAAYGGWLFSAGGRLERVQVDSDGDGTDAAAEPRFGAPQQRRFTPASAVLGVRSAEAEGLLLSANLGRSQRAPAYHELYADGVHLATAAYERGDPGLGTESGRHVDLGIGFARAGHSVKLSAFATRFSRYIALQASGFDFTLPEDEGAVPEYLYRGVPARLSGYEIEAQSRFALGGLTLQLSGVADSLRGSDRSTGEPLPRLPPYRARLAAEVQGGAWRAGAGVRHAAAQRRVPAVDTATPGWTQVDLWAAGDVLAGGALTWLVKLTNAGDRLAFNAASVATIRGLSPLPGRALTVALQGRF